MSKFKRIIEFILALLNFLFHFKPVPDDETPIVPATDPRLAPPPGPTWPVAVFEAIP